MTKYISTYKNSNHFEFEQKSVISPFEKNTKKTKTLKKRRLRRDERNIVVNKRVSENENFTHTLFPLMANKKN